MTPDENSASNEAASAAAAIVSKAIAAVLAAAGEQDTVMAADDAVSSQATPTSSCATSTANMSAPKGESASEAPCAPQVPPPLAAGAADKLCQAFGASQRKHNLRMYMLARLRHTSPVYAKLLAVVIQELRALEPPVAPANTMQRTAPRDARADVAAVMRSNASSRAFTGFQNIEKVRREARLLTGNSSAVKTDFMSADRKLQARSEGAGASAKLSVWKRDEPYKEARRQACAAHAKSMSQLQQLLQLQAQVQQPGSQQPGVQSTTAASLPGQPQPVAVTGAQAAGATSSAAPQPGARPALQAHNSQEGQMLNTQTGDDVRRAGGRAQVQVMGATRLVNLALQRSSRVATMGGQTAAVALGAPVQHAPVACRRARENDENADITQPSHKAAKPSSEAVDLCSP
jgi:hypothetical protein